MNNCEICGKKLSKSKYTRCNAHRIGNNTGNKASIETRLKMSIKRKGRKPALGKHWKIKDTSNYGHKGEKHPSWKGDDVGYKGLHKWIRDHKPMSMFCEKCGKITDKLDAANISGEYKRDISDFRWLCRKCHNPRGHK